MITTSKKTTPKTKAKASPTPIEELRALLEREQTMGQARHKKIETLMKGYDELKADNLALWQIVAWLESEVTALRSQCKYEPGEMATDEDAAHFLVGTKLMLIYGDRWKAALASLKSK